MAEGDPFMSPESTSARQVMSPNVATGAALLEGEQLGPNYGAVDATRYEAGLANGVRPETRSDTTGRPEGSNVFPRRSSLDASGRVGLESQDRSSGSDAATFSAGLGARTAVIGSEARVEPSPQTKVPSRS